MILSHLILLEKNPYKLKGDKELELLKNSIEKFKKMMSIRKIIIDENNNVLGGNKRVLALKALGYKEIPDSWIDKRTDLSEDEKKEFIVRDNINFGIWQYDILNEWDVPVEDWGIDIPDWGIDSDEQIDNESSTQNTQEPKINDRMIMKLEFTEDEYRYICGELSKIDANKETALLKLFSYENAPDSYKKI